MTLPDAAAGQPATPEPRSPEPRSPGALRGLPAFVTEPPYDDETPGTGTGSAGGGTGTGTGTGTGETRTAKDAATCGAGDDEVSRTHVGRRGFQPGTRRGPGTAGSSHGRSARHGTAAHRGPGNVRLPASAPASAAAASRGLPRATDDAALRTVSGRSAAATPPAARRAPLRMPPQVRDSRFRENPAPAATIVVRAIVEVLSGLRPVSHLAGWATPRLQSALERSGSQFPSRASVRSIRVGEPRPGVAEVVAVVNRGDRVAALALRMESTSGRWQVTHLQIG